MRSGDRGMGALRQGAGTSRGRAAIVRFSPFHTDVRREAEALASVGFGVDVYCLRTSGPEAEPGPGIELIRLPLPKIRSGVAGYLGQYASWFAACSVALGRAHRREPYRIVQFNSLPDHQVFVATAARLRGAAIVLFLKEPMAELFDTLFGRPRLTRAIARVSDAAIRRADLVFCVSEPHRRVYIARGHDPRRIVSVLNAMPLDGLGGDEIAPRPPGAFRVVCHGTIEHRWGHEVMIDAVARIRSRVPGIELVLTGRGGHLPIVLERARATGVDDVVRHLGYLAYDDLGALLRSADVGIATQLASPYSDLVHTGKMFELLGLGIPTIVSDLAAVRHDIGPDEARFVRPGDPDAMASALLELASDPAAAERLGEAGRRRHAALSWSVQRGRYLDAIGAVLGHDQLGRSGPASGPDLAPASAG